MRRQLRRVVGSWFTLSLLAGCRADKAVFQFRMAHLPTTECLNQPARLSQPTGSVAARSEDHVDREPSTLLRHVAAHDKRPTRTRAYATWPASSRKKTTRRRWAARLQPATADPTDSTRAQRRATRRQPFDFRKNGLGLAGLGALIALLGLAAGSGGGIVTGLIGYVFFILGLVYVGIGLILLLIHAARQSRNSES